MIGRVIAERYHVETLIGRGGMGNVYLASNTRIRRRVALKIFNPEMMDDKVAVERFEREAHIAGSLSHPHVIELLDFDRTAEGVPYIVMEYLEGEPLGQRVEQDGPMTPAQAAPILCQICSALEMAHSRGIIHRDVKPQNIFLCDHNGRHDFVKMLDFGIAHMAGTRGRLTHHGEVVGTPQYMSPEQITQGPENLDPRTDIYALGMVLFKMLAGTIPHLEKKSSVPAVLYDIVHRASPRLDDFQPNLPPAIVGVVHNAVAKVQAERYPSMVAFWRAYDDALKSSGIEALGPPLPAWLPGEEPLASERRPPLFTELTTNDAGRITGPVSRKDPALETTASHLTQTNPTLQEPVRRRNASVPSVAVTNPTQHRRRAVGVGVFAVLAAMGIVAFFLWLKPAVQTAQPGVAQPTPIPARPIPDPAKSVATITADASTVISGSQADAAAPAAPKLAAARPALAKPPATKPGSQTVAPAAAARPPKPKPRAVTRRLWLTTTPPGAEVRAGHRRLGVTPLAARGLTVRRTDLVLRKAGYAPRVITIPAGKGEYRVPNVVLRRLDAPKRAGDTSKTRVPRKRQTDNRDPWAE